MYIDAQRDLKLSESFSESLRAAAAAAAAFLNCNNSLQKSNEESVLFLLIAGQSLFGKLGDILRELGDIPRELGDIPGELGDIPGRAGRHPERAGRHPWRNAFGMLSRSASGML